MPGLNASSKEIVTKFWKCTLLSDTLKDDSKCPCVLSFIPSTDWLSNQVLRLQFWPKMPKQFSILSKKTGLVYMLGAKLDISIFWRASSEWRTNGKCERKQNLDTTRIFGHWDLVGCWVAEWFLALWERQISSVLVLFWCCTKVGNFLTDNFERQHRHFDCCFFSLADGRLCSFLFCLGQLMSSAATAAGVHSLSDTHRFTHSLCGSAFWAYLKLLFV